MKNLSIIAILVIALIGCKKESEVAPSNKTSNTVTYSDVEMSLNIPSNDTVAWVNDSTFIGTIKLYKNNVYINSRSYNLGIMSLIAGMDLGTCTSGDEIKLEYSVGVVSNGSNTGTYDTKNGRTATDPNISSYNYASITWLNGNLKYIEFLDTTAKGLQTAQPTIYTITLP